nr:protein kinase [Deltaproteobacteria bacterium]
TQFGVTPALGTPRPPAAGLTQSQDPHAPVAYAHTAYNSTSQSAPYQTAATGYQSIVGPQATPTGALGLVPGAYIHHYELIRELGRGGMGVVYAARDTKLGRRVAMKFLLNATQDVAERFIVEARATAQCNHENIVIIHEVDQLDNLPYMVLEFLEGDELRRQLGVFNSGSRLPQSRVVELMLPVARALARAHQLGIVHRDLKPENIFVTSAGQVKVLDFGIAKATSQREAGASMHTSSMVAQGDVNLTGDGGLVGTLPYMSPEQFGMDTVDHRSDIWAFGIILHEMLVGHHPVDPLTPHDLMLAAGSVDESFPAPIQRVPELDPGLSRLVELCLRKRRNERLGTAAELVRRLEELLPGRRGRQLAEGESPFPGLTAFQETDADRFFGRSRDIARMVARVRELPLTGIVGPSGVGKSSFVRAGIGPALKSSGENWEVVTIRPGRHPLAALSSIAHRLTTRSGAFEGHLGEHDALMHRLRNEPGYLGSLLRQRARMTGGNILLFVDQFEELYTLVPELAERRAFTAALAGVADDTASPLRVVVSMRSDFLDRIAEDPHFMDDLSRGLVFLQPPDRGGLRDALVQPVEMSGHRYESLEIVDDMLNALGNTPGALPLLQFAASKLWDARDRQNRMLTVASYRAIGGISGALASHADEVVANMNAPAQKLTQRICRRLVTPERTRAIVEIADLYQLTPDPTEIARVLDQLVAARLLVVQTRGDGGGGTVEIVHESLIDRWPTLRRWLDEDQEDAAYVAQLATAAKQWDAKGRPTGLLWRGDAMDEARRWYAQRTRELAPRDRAFLDAVFALATRGKRMRRVALTLVMLVLGGVAAGASVMLVRVQDAKDEATRYSHKVEEQMATVENALAQATKKERERQIAEDEKTAAEGKVAGLTAGKDKAEAERLKAEEDKKKAEQAAVEVTKMSKEQLEAKNSALERQAAQLSVALKEAKETRAKVEKINAAHEATIAKLKQDIASQKLSTTLKDR